MSKDRVAFVVLQVDGDVARAMGSLAAERDGVGLAQIRRPTVSNDPATLGTLVTGVNPLRHGAFTRQVPALGATQGSSPAMVEADLRTRNSRDFGAPTIWNRLSSRGVRTAVIGWPYAEVRDDEQVHELGMRSVMALGRANELTIPHAMLGALKAAIDAEPEIGCVCVHGWFRDRKAGRSDEDGTEGETVEDDTADADEEETGDDEKTPDEIARGKAERVFSWFEALQETSSSTHLLAVLIAPRIGRFILMGPRADAIDGNLPTLNAAAPTVLSLLGQPPASDLPGRSIVGSDAGEAAASGSSWSIEGGETTPPDFEPSIARVLAGEGGDLLRQTVVRHLVQRHWLGISQGKPAESLEAAQRLVELHESPANRLRLVLAMIANQQNDRISEEIETLRERHPDSAIADLVTTLPVMRSSEEEISAVLDRVPFEALQGWLPRGVWARAAARAGRKDDAMTALWRLIIAGYAMNQDRLSFARLAVDRNQDQDAQRAVLATRGMTGLASGREGRPRVGVALLRAKALSLSGRQPAAIRLLEQFVEHHPLEEQAVNALDGLRRTAAARPDGE